MSIYFFKFVESALSDLEDTAKNPKWQYCITGVE
jgi:hypothetical protein